jgi:CRP/FNR family cyclic AMP-dependent transcriptional regulator
VVGATGEHTSGRGLLDTLGDDDRRRLLATTQRRRFAAGEVIFHEGDRGDSVYLIERGHVAIRVGTALGDVATLTMLGPGSAFGELALLDGKERRSASAVAIGATDTRVVDHAGFEALRRDHPPIERFLVELLAAQVRRLSDLAVEAMFVAADIRVLRRLIAVADQLAVAPGAVIAITQDDLASMAGTTRPTANRVLKRAETDGLLRLTRGRIEILDAEGLAHRAR